MSAEQPNPGNSFPTKNRCEHCGAAFTTAALLQDHLVGHASRATPEQKSEPSSVKANDDREKAGYEEVRSDRRDVCGNRRRRRDHEVPRGPRCGIVWG